jgi:hypothetical protein
MNPLNYLSLRLSVRSLVVFGATALMIQSSQATLLFSEGFDYTAPGNLGGNVNPSSGYTWGPGNNAMQVTSGDLSYAGLPDLGGNQLQLTWGPPSSAGSITNGYANVTSGTLYYSFLLDMTTLPSASSYLTSMNPGTSTPNGSTDALAFYFGTVTGGGGVRFGLRGGGASTAFTPSTSLYSANNIYFVVLGYDFNGGVALNNLSLYVNPTPGDSMPSPTLTLTPNTVAAGIDNIGFKIQSSPSGVFLVDDLRVGTTWADVTPAPEPSTFALAGLGMLGFALARRMRR